MSLANEKNGGELEDGILERRENGGMVFMVGLGMVWKAAGLWKHLIQHSNSSVAFLTKGLLKGVNITTLP